MRSSRSATPTSRNSAAIPSPEIPVPSPASRSVSHLAPRAWLLAIRPKTLSAAVAPVVVGAALAAHDGVFRPLPALAALVGALLIQIGTNLANDVLDFRRGADHAARLGPTRVVQAGLLSAQAVSLAAIGTFGLAALVGLYLVSVAGLPILAVGVAGILSGVLYTAGPYPLAYVGLGDPFVMVFFGLAAVAGTYYVQALTVTPTSLALGAAVGALAVGILTVNNLRDIGTDGDAGKRTLVVRMGVARARVYYAFLVVQAFVIPVSLWLTSQLGAAVLVVLLAVPLARPPVQQVRGGLTGAPLNKVLAQTARLQTAHALLLAAGLLL